MGWQKLLKNLLFPKFCFICRRFGKYLCDSCAGKLATVKKDICVYCDRGSYFGLTHPSCQNSLRLDGLKSLFYYEGRAKRIIAMIKYKLVTDSVEEFIGAIPKSKQKEMAFFKKLHQDLILIPVPLHPKRQARRGFNQSLQYAMFFSQILSIPIENKGIIRVKNTTPQVQLKNPKERYNNMISAFQMNPRYDVKQKNIIIIDDVWTTGSTIKEMCRTLKRAGAGKVYGVTMARVYK